MGIIVIEVVDRTSRDSNRNTLTVALLVLLVCSQILSFLNPTDTGTTTAVLWKTGRSPNSVAILSLYTSDVLSLTYYYYSHHQCQHLEKN